MQTLAQRQLRGFTLIELLVVIAIIGILSSVILASLSTARDRARLTKAFSTMQELNKAAYLCSLSDSLLNTPPTNTTGGTVLCSASTVVLPDLSDIGFTYCGSPGCGGWSSSSAGYAFSIYSDSYPGDRKIVVCGSDLNATGWFYVGSPFDFTGTTGCKKSGF